MLSYKEIQRVYEIKDGYLEAFANKEAELDELTRSHKSGLLKKIELVCLTTQFTASYYIVYVLHMCVYVSGQYNVGWLLCLRIHTWKPVKLTLFFNLELLYMRGLLVPEYPYLHKHVIKKRGPIFSSMFTPLNTVIVTIFTSIFLQEHVYFGSVIGALGIITELYVIL
uniref:WAT1-related protein At4g30420-like n=1 Tax=Tanacetum cinerariifolium TaxID=118510 RepID=A0A699IZR2_TANCI|nr:WAT1-related protein At4g30420-like [Tanacetum cinerariifolium]